MSRPLLRIVGGTDTRAARTYDARVGGIIREWRNAAGMSLPEAGKPVGLSGAQVSRYELGESPLTVRLASAFSNLYGKSLRDLIEAAHVA